MHAGEKEKREDLMNQKNRFRKGITFILSGLLAVTTNAGCLSRKSSDGSAGSSFRRDWSLAMKMPDEKQLAEAGRFRSPYIAFFPQYEESLFTAVSMDFRMSHDPAGTYICPIVWSLNTEGMHPSYKEIRTDYGQELSGYFGFQVLDDGTKAVIMTLWNAFCEDYEGNVSMIKAKVLYPEGREGKELTDTGEGSFVQCIYPYDWQTDTDYRFLLEQSTGESGTELYNLTLLNIEENEKIRLFCFDSGLEQVFIQSVCGFVENFEPRFASWPRSLEFWNAKAREKDSGQWRNAEAVNYTVNASEGDLEYEGSWNYGSDEHGCWIITSGTEGLCTPPDNTGPYPIPSSVDQPS